MKNKITKEEFEAAEKVIKDYKTQILEDRKKRVPRFGDSLCGISGNHGRYIGKGQMAYKDSVSSELKRDLVDFEVDWNCEEPELNPDSFELVLFIRESNWIE